MADQPLIPEISIIIVDDDQLVRDFAVQTIEYSINRKVSTFENGLRAWQYIQQQSQNTDIIIADANIPDINGIELLDKVKKSYPDITFVITSSNPAFEKKAYQLGAEAFLTKPYDVNDLFTIVREFIMDHPANSNPDIKTFPKNPDNYPENR